MLPRLLAVLVTASTAALAQNLVVDYPDSVLGSPAGQYPIYTGSGTNVIRCQIFRPGTGQSAFPFPIPNQPALTGVVFDAQWGVLDPGSASPLGIATSSSAKLVLF